jgi:hypothetical protein
MVIVGIPLAHFISGRLLMPVVHVDGWRHYHRGSPVVRLTAI